MLHIDSWVRNLFQRFYEFLLDQFGVQIGSFRMVIAVVPPFADWAIRIAKQEPLGSLLLSGLILGALMSGFYNRRAMRIDNRLQVLGRLLTINATSQRFQTRTLHIRLFYLLLFPITAALIHHFDGFALLDIAFARCVRVRPRVRREREVPMLLRFAGA